MQTSLNGCGPSCLRCAHHMPSVLLAGLPILTLSGRGCRGLIEIAEGSPHIPADTWTSLWPMTVDLICGRLQQSQAQQEGQMQRK